MLERAIKENWLSVVGCAAKKLNLKQNERE
jgi:hypothetical protein